MRVVTRMGVSIVAGVLVLGLLCFATSVTASGLGNACQSFDDCLAQIEQSRVGKPPEALAKNQDELNDELLRQDHAIQKLVGMLADPNLDRANIAAAALRQARYIDPHYLPQIEKGLDRGLDWLPPALGRIPSNDAAQEAVHRLMASKDAPDNQEAYAVELSGKRAIPYIVEAARCNSNCLPNQAIILGSVLARMGADAAGAVTPLTEIATDSTSSREMASDAILMLADMGEVAQPADQSLIALRAARPSLARVIDRALIETHSTEAGSIYSRWLAESGGDYGQLRELGQIGRAGYDAGPAVVAILEHAQGETRVSAAQALGLIGYRPGIPALIDALNNTADVRLNGAAAEALGRLGDPSATPALRHAEQTHWFPPVRDAAAEALQHIERGTPYPPVTGDNRFDYVDGFIFPRRATYGGRCDSNGEPTGKDRTMAVPGGQLLVEDNGEWGASLKFLSPGRREQMIFQQRVVSLQRFQGKIIAVAGIDDYILNSGGLFLVAPGADGMWHATLWRMLPAAPSGARMQNTHEMLIWMAGGYEVLVGSSGTMRVPDCS